MEIWTHGIKYLDAYLDAASDNCRNNDRKEERADVDDEDQPDVTD